MGLCFSTLTEEMRQEIAQSSKLEKGLEQSKTKEKRTLKILLLGTGESGKSTIFKQMQILYQGGFNELVKTNYRSVVQKNVLDSMQNLIKAVYKFGLPFDASEEKRAAEVILAQESVTAENCQELSTVIEYLWLNSPSIQDAYKRRNEFYIIDSAKYYFDQIGSIMTADYIPDNEAILRARLKTTGIMERVFIIETVGFHFVDVGGQRNERRKWIHCFAGVTTILFIAAISEYDQVLYEEEKVNRMMESLEVFQSIVNSQFFEETPLILFLNKRDLLEEKIKNKVDPSVCFPEYTGGPDADKAAAFIERQYISRVKNKGRDVFCHQVTAIDTNNLQRVWNDCRGIILRQCLEASGLRF